jgi:uncharacterized membrane protein YwzB
MQYYGENAFCFYHYIINTMMMDSVLLNQNKEKNNVNRVCIVFFNVYFSITVAVFYLNLIEFSKR